MIGKIASLLLVGFVFVGCARKSNEFHNNGVEPSISGLWTGSVKINGVASTVTIDLKQDNVSVKGTYSADGTSSVLAADGTVSGATTGPTFSMDILGNTPACIQTLQMGGQNSGTELSFNLTGTDCNGIALRGEAFLKKS